MAITVQLVSQSKTPRDMEMYYRFVNYIQSLNSVTCRNFHKQMIINRSAEEHNASNNSSEELNVPNNSAKNTQHQAVLQNTMYTTIILQRT